MSTAVVYIFPCFTTVRIVVFLYTVYIIAYVIRHWLWSAFFVPDTGFQLNDGQKTGFVIIAFIFSWRGLTGELLYDRMLKNIWYNSAKPVTTPKTTSIDFFNTILFLATRYGSWNNLTWGRRNHFTKKDKQLIDIAYLLTFLKFGSAFLVTVVAFLLAKWIRSGKKTFSSCDR